MTQLEAIKIFIQTARLAQGKGILSFEDAEIVLKAIRVFESPREEPHQPIDPSEPVTPEE